MANYATLKAAIQQVIKTNGNEEITGALLQQSLLAMVNSLGAYYQFVGVAHPSTNPGTPDQNVFFIAGSGTYPNFNNTTVPDGYMGVFKYNGSWAVETLQVGKNYDTIIKQISQFCIEDSLNNQIQFLNIENEAAAKSGGLYVYQIQADYNAFYLKDANNNTFGIFNIVGGQESAITTTQYGKIRIILKPSYQNATSSLNQYNIGEPSYYTRIEKELQDEIANVDNDLQQSVSTIETEIKEKHQYCIEDALNNQILFLNIQNEAAAKSGGLYLYQIQANYNAVYFKDSSANSIGIFNIVAGQEASISTQQYGKISIVLKPSYQNATSSLNQYNIGDLSYYTYFEQQAKDNIGDIQRELNEDYVKIDKTYNIFNPVTQGYVSIQNTILDGDTPAYVTSDWVELKQGQRVILSANNAQVIRIYVGSDKLPTTSGGHRVDYISAYQGVHDGRYYAEYRATVDCFIRASTVRVGEPMLEISENQYPRPYVEYKYQLPGNLNFTLPQMGGNIWNGKRVLCIGDSLTAAGIWQQKLSENLGMIVSTHALGGIGFPQMLDGVTVGDETLPPLAQSDVIDKDLIIIYGGYNHRAGVVGEPGDLYPTQQTTIGALQYLINGVYNLLAGAGNLKCRIVVICPHCAGAYSYVPYNWNEEYPIGSGRTGETVANGIIECARYNRIASFDLFHNSGINQNTWSVFSASPTPTTGGTVNDQLHLNASVGYPYLGDRIADWVKTV